MHLFASNMKIFVTSFSIKIFQRD